MKTNYMLTRLRGALHERKTQIQNGICARSAKNDVRTILCHAGLEVVVTRISAGYMVDGNYYADTVDVQYHMWFVARGDGIQGNAPDSTIHREFESIQVSVLEGMSNRGYEWDPSKGLYIKI